jgi:hypothetical protein
MTQRKLGYHWMDIVGWRKDGTWDVLNIHWTKQFGKDGHCFIPYWFNQEELWAIVPKKEENQVIEL